MANIQCMMNVMNKFGAFSGLFMNLDKSRIILPHIMRGVIRHSISSFAAIKNSINFGTYLGVNISPNKLSRKGHCLLLNKTKERIQGYQSKLLILAGRCTLIKSVLNSYPVNF